MKIIKCIFNCFVAVVFILSSQQVGAQTPKVKFETYELPNGLDVVLYENHSTPLVAINVWYHVGSKNEVKGKTGFAHLFEHMMFQGSEHFDREYFEPLEKIGAEVNGSTSEDRTNYYEVLPSNYLELALWLESDRMGYLLPAMTQEKLNNQRDVVKNEKRQSYDNQPYGKSNELLSHLLYPPEHPYSWQTIGSMEDLDAASVEDVSKFFQKYYTPNNTSLVIAGDFNPTLAKMLVKKYFGSIPAGEPVNRLKSWIPALKGTKRMVAYDNVSLPRLYMAWHTPAYFAPGDAELDLLAEVLAGGKTARLYKTLVYDKQIAQDVTAYQASADLGSTFNIIVTSRAQHSLDEIERVVEQELEKLLKKGISKRELQMGQASWEGRFVRNLQEVGGIADKLNEYNYYLEDPGKFEWDAARYAMATPRGVIKFAKDYIGRDNRAILWILPQGKRSVTEENINRTATPTAATEPKFTPPNIKRDKLSNGAELLVVEDHRLPLVHANVMIKSGWAEDPKGKPATAALTAELLNEGTKKRNALQISDVARRLGAVLGTNSSFDASVVGLNVLKKNFDPALALLSDILLNPTFPQDELERQRALYLGRIDQETKQPVRAAVKTFQRLLFGPDHPYAQPYTGSGTKDSITNIARNDLVNYYRAHYLPNNAAIVVVGDITLKDAKAKLEKSLKSWKQGVVKKNDITTPAPPPETMVYLVDKPGAPQSTIIAGHLGTRRDDPDYLAKTMANAAFGGQFTSRLNLNLREDKGYSYGVGSLFLETVGVGPYLVYTNVEASTTDESIKEIVKEMKDVVGSRPFTEIEVADAKGNLIRSFPHGFQAYEDMANSLSDLVVFDLSLDEWQTYIPRLNAITTATASSAAKDLFKPEALVIVVVGDKQIIESDLKKLNLGAVMYSSP